MIAAGGGLPISVYVADDHERARQALVEFIDSANGVVVVGSSGGSAAKAISEIVALHPQIVVLDSQVGDSDGLDVCRRLADVAPTVSCILVTAGIGLSWGRAEAEQAGAAAFIIKEIVDFPIISVITNVAAAASPAV